MPSCRTCRPSSEVLPDYQPGSAWIGFLAPPRPAGRDRRAAQHAEIVRILNSAEVLQILGENGLEVDRQHAVRIRRR